MNEIVNYSVEELINKISNSQITSVEICEAYIAVSYTHLRAHET